MFRSRSEEALKDPYHYVQNPLNCLKILTALVVDINVVVKHLLEQMSTKYNYEQQLLDIDEKHLDNVVADLANYVSKNNVSWDEFLLTQDNFDSK